MRSAGHHRVAHIVAAVVAVIALCCSPALAVPALAAPAATSCAPVTIVMLAGTGETSEAADPHRAVGMLKGVTDRVKKAVGDQVEILYPGYSASAFNKGKTYVESKDTGKQALRTVLQNLCSTTQVVIGGYSQGGDSAGDVASDIGNNRGPIPASRVLAVALLADPGRGTPGEALVGPNITPGVGVGGDRPGGMGALAGRVATICDTGSGATPGDMYCNLDRKKYPLVSSISQMLAMTPAEAKIKTAEEQQITGLPGTVGPSATGQPSASQLTSAMTQDWSSADLGGLGTNVSKLSTALAPKTATSGGGVDVGQVASLASSVGNTLQPLLALQQSGTTDKTTRADLSSSPSGSPDRDALTVLDQANKSDLQGAVTSAQQIASTATTLAGQQGGTSSTALSATDPRVAQLGSAAQQLGSQTAPLISTPSAAMDSASSVLSVLAPQKVIEQILNVVVGMGSTNWVGIVTSISQAIQRAVALDVAGVRKAAQDLNVAIAPLVKMAAQIDFKWISGILRLIPDPTGYTQIAATVLDYVGNLDVIRVVNNIQRIEGIAFDVLEHRNPARLADLVPVGLDMATVASGVLNGGSKTAATGYQPNQAANSTLSSQVSNVDFLGLTNSMTQLASSDDANNLAGLVDAGLQVSQFVGGATRNHVNYGNYKVDNSGRSALEWLADWITLKVQRVHT